MFRNAEDSEDALQDALLLAFRKMHQFEGRSSFTTWIHSIVRNTSRAYYRKATAHPTLSTDQESGEEGAAERKELVDERPTPEESYAARERSEIFQRAADELPERYQAAVYQFYLRGLGEEAAAKALGITVSALKAQLHRSRILLSYQIRKSCVADVRAELLRARPFLRRHREVRLRKRRAVGSFAPPGKLARALN
jgi:RNA polymerase sigma-70 factor (ECF subfamily)